MTKEEKLLKIINSLTVRGFTPPNNTPWIMHKNTLNLLRKDSIRLRRLFEKECNDSSKSPEYWNRLQEMTIIRISERCKKLNISYYIQTDCRGCALWLGTSSDTNYLSEGIPCY